MTDTITIDREFLERQLAVGLEYQPTSGGESYESLAKGMATHLWNNALQLPQPAELYDAEFEADLRQARWEAAVAAAAGIMGIVNIPQYAYIIDLQTLTRAIFEVMSLGPPKEDGDALSN